MKSKKMISMLLVGGMTLGLLTGCGSQEETQTNETQQETQIEADTSEDAGSTGDTATSTGETGNTLIVYYSATGNTEAVANTIAEATRGDLFELEPTEPYSDADLNWTDENSRVSVEHENKDERAVELVADTVDNWDSYNTVFIGYPKLYPTNRACI